VLIRHTLKHLFLKAITRQSLLWALCVLIAVSFCWSKHFSSIPVIVMSFLFLADKNIFPKLNNVLANKNTWLFFIITIWYALWMLLATDMQMATSTLERKAVYIIFPMVFAGSVAFTTRQYRLLYDAFCISCFVVLVYCQSIALIRYFNSDTGFNYLTYENLANPIMHPGYFSNYFTLAFLWLCAPIVFKTETTYIKPLYRNILIAIFIYWIAMLTSKTAFIIIIIFMAWFVLKLMLGTFNIKTKLLIFCSAIAMVVGMFVLVNITIAARFKDITTLPPITPKVGFCESVNSRRAAALEGYNKVQEVWHVGYGTGMANAKLMEQLTEKKYESLVAFNMHTHNQFMHTWLDLGFWGMLYLILFLLYLLYYFIKTKNVMGIGISIITIINCLTDDMLEIQAGFVFFMFFICVEMFAKNKTASASAT
jgi:O-antigen ligase